MASTLLWDSVKALRDKIEATAAGANAEQLAYLGNALEKLAGPLSMIDLVELVNQLQIDLNATASTATGTIGLAATAAQDAAVATINGARDAAVLVIGTADDGPIADLNAAILSAQAAAAALTLAGGIKTSKLYFFSSI